MRAVVALALVAGAAACKFDRPADVPGDDVDDIDADDDIDGDPPPDAMPDPAMLATEQGAHDFGDVTTGQTSATLSVVVSNDGEQASGAVSVTLAGANPGDFALVPVDDGDCEAAILDPQDTCMAQVRFVPTTAGARAATLRIEATPGGTVDVPLSGDGLSPGNLVVTSGSVLEFGDVEIQSQSTTQSVTVQNTGGTATASLTVELGNPTDYTKVADTCMGTALGASATCTVSVRFNPTAVGTRGSSIAIRESQDVGITASATGRGSARIQVTNSGTGTITSVPSGISCGSTCTGTFTQTPVTLVAAAGSGFAFDGWGGACASAGTNTMCSVSLTTPLTMVSSSFRALECTPSTTVCDDAMGRYVECGPTGEIVTELQCPLGCASGMEKCVDVDPSNGLAMYLDMTATAPDVTFSGSSSINTSTGGVSNGGVTITVPNFVDSATGIRVFAFNSLSLAGTVKVHGSRKLALVVNGDVTITGTLDLSADGTTPGPGSVQTDGSSQPDACQGSTAINPGITNPTPGAGGGGHYNPGAPGGAAGNGTTLTGGGAARESNSDLVPLDVGCPGGGILEYNGNATPLSTGGGGGGAVQIVSRTRVSITGAGKIDASGGGGGSCNVICGPAVGGGGGGSGGGVLLEAPTIILDGSGVVISTKGGSGAAAGQGASSSFGRDGGTDAAAAAGGTTSGLASGGVGGTSTAPPGAGSAGTTGNDGGGGGGSVGRTRMNTSSGVVNPQNGAAIRSRSTVGTLTTRLVP